MAESDARKRRRVVVTGVGLVSPLAVGTEETWAGHPRRALRDRTDHAVRRGAATRRGSPARCTGFDPLRLDRQEGRQEVRALHPVRDRRHDDGGGAERPVDRADNAARVGVVIGSGIGGFEVIEREHRMLLERGPDRVSPFFILSSIVNLAAGQVSVRLGAKGPNSAVATACTTGAHAIGDAFRLIQRGYADAMICGGAEASITPLGVAGFAAMRALSHAQRRPRAREPAVGRRPRRLRRRRRRRHPRARGDRGRPSGAARRSSPRSSATA